MAAEASTVLEGGLRLSYATQGDSVLPLVLLPGPTDSWRSYQPVLDHLPPSVRAIAVSQRGHGDSDKPATGYAVEDFAGDVVALLDALGIERAVLAGHSGSCLVVRRVAIGHPDRVAGLVLEASPMSLHGDPKLSDFVEGVVSKLEDPIDPDFARSFVVDTSSGELAPATVDRLVDELLKVPASVWHGTFDGLLQHDDADDLDRITAPALLVWGAADGLVGRDMQDELLRRLPNARLVTYDGVGHTPRWEEPARFAADLTSFTERVRVAGLPYVDEHAIDIAASAQDVWAELLVRLDRAFSGAAAAGCARVVGCVEHRSAGPRPLREGSSLPGFKVIAATPPSELVLAGRHRFSEYGLSFHIDERGARRAGLRAERGQRSRG